MLFVLVRVFIHDHVFDYHEWRILSVAEVFCGDGRHRTGRREDTARLQGATAAALQHTTAALQHTAAALQHTVAVVAENS